MREFKFRSWDGEKMYNIELLGRHVLTSCDDEGRKPSKNRSLIVMQYTGLHDKNGVEIYEGDVLADAHKNSPNVVFWQQEEGCWAVRGCFGIDHWDYLLEVDFEHFGVVGDIYQNPELLEAVE